MEGAQKNHFKNWEGVNYGFTTGFTKYLLVGRVSCENTFSYSQEIYTTHCYIRRKEISFELELHVGVIKICY